MKLISLNVEGQKHLVRVKQFLAKENADVVCLMEAVEEDVINWSKRGYAHYVYAPNDILIGVPTGVVIMSKRELSDIEVFYAGENIDNYLAGKEQSHCPVVLKVVVGELVIGVVHYSWTPDGEVDERQRGHVQKLLEWVGEKEMILCGDFNIPRGKEVYQLLASHWKDNIPKTITTTIDPKLHRVNIIENGKLALVVDYIWSTPKYRVSNVRVIGGVSDHCGVACEVV